VLGGLPRGVGGLAILYYCVSFWFIFITHTRCS
jgi:hypothetical protein